MPAINAQLIGSPPDYEAILSRFVATAAQKIRQRMREKLHDQKHGTLYAKNRGEGFTRAHQASAPGEAPASDTGAFERSLNIVRKGTLEADLETNLGYPGLLEFGTGKMQPRPLWLAAIDELLPVLENDLRRAMMG